MERKLVKMKILVLTESLRINSTSSGIVSSTFIEMLSTLDQASIHVITQNDFTEKVDWFKNNVFVEKFNLPIKNKNFIQKIPKIRAIHSYIFGYNVESKNIIKAWEKEITRVLDETKFDYIFVLGSGMSFYPHFAMLSIKTNVPFIVNIHDPFPIHTYPFPYRKEKSILSFVAEKKFNKVLNKAHKITLPSENLLQSLIPFYSVLKQKGVVIPHIGTSIQNLPSLECDENIQLDATKINIIHAGSLLGPRNPEFLFKAIYNLYEKDKNSLDNLHFTFIGKVAREHKNIVIEEKYKKNISFLDQRISYKKSLELIKQSDAVFVIEAISKFSPFMPGKLADIFYYKKPIIALCPKISETMNILTSDYPYYSELNDVEAITVILQQLINDLKNNEVIFNFENQKMYVSIEVNQKLIREKVLN